MFKVFGLLTAILFIGYFLIQFIIYLAAFIFYIFLALLLGLVLDEAYKRAEKRWPQIKDLHFFE